MDYNDVYEIAIGSFLHDIGKFGQRAGVKLSPEIKNIESHILPEDKYHYYTHRHALYTYQFLSEFENIFKSKRKNFNSSQDNLINFAIYHHKPSTPIQNIIQKADQYASGVQREEIKEGTTDFKQVRLTSIFQQISLKDKRDYKDEDYRYDVAKLSPDSIFPSKDFSTPPDFNKAYNDFHKEFKEFAQESDKMELFHFFNSLISLCEKYLWCVPADTREKEPVTSLFDHSYVTSAIATSLYLFHKYTNSLEDEESIKNDEIEKILIISGSVGGIQNYIYGLYGSSFRNITKILRARSFFVKLISKLITHKILKLFNLPPANLIVNAGGRFLILAPDIREIKEKLNKLYSSINKYIFSLSNGELYLNLDYSISVKGKDFQKERFARIFDKIEEKIELVKKQKFINILKDKRWEKDKFILDKLYYKFSIEKETGYCKICGKFPAETSVDDIVVCHHCAKQIEIGRKLINSKYIAYSYKEVKSLEGFSFFDKEIFVYFSSDTLLIKNLIDRFYLVEEIYDQESAPFFTTIYLDNYIPVKEEENKKVPLTTEEIVEYNLSENSEGKRRGYKKLGILKADVDNLGLIFSYGLKKEFTISKFVTLSRMINLFFTMYIKHLQETKYKNIYTVYSGGDDLFLFSDWETIIKFSYSLYRDFKKFTCNNPDITFSAGIFIADEKFPVKRGAEYAEELLEISKNRGKDSLTIFNTTFKWNKFKTLENFKDLLSKEELKIPHSFLHRLLKYLRSAMEWKQEKSSINFVYYPRLIYDLRRNFEDEKYEEFKKEVKKFFSPETEEFENYIFCLKFPLYWAILKRRRS